MRPSEVQGYLAEKLKALNLKESADPFGSTIPSNTLDLTYTFEPGQVSVESPNQVSSRFVMPVVLSIYFKDYRTHTDLRTAAYKKMEEIFGLLLNADRSLKGGGFLIKPTGVVVQPMDQKNQACAVMKLDLEISLYLQFRGL